jgi:hypothetical protein
VGSHPGVRRPKSFPGQRIELADRAYTRIDETRARRLHDLSRSTHHVRIAAAKSQSRLRCAAAHAL